MVLVVALGCFGCGNDSDDGEQFAVADDAGEAGDLNGEGASPGTIADGGGPPMEQDDGDFGNAAPTPGATPPSAPPPGASEPIMALRRPPGVATPPPDLVAGTGQPDPATAAGFEASCFDPLDVMAYLPAVLTASPQNAPGCVSMLQTADVDQSCGPSVFATWALDVESCVMALYFPLCTAGGGDTAEIRLIIGALPNGSIWVQAEGADFVGMAVCTWDPEQSGEPPTGDDSCEFANDRECDEPDVCPLGTDMTDCAPAPAGGMFAPCGANPDCEPSLYCDPDLRHCTRECFDDLDCELNQGGTCNQVQSRCHINCGNAGTNGDCPEGLDCELGGSALFLCLGP